MAVASGSQFTCAVKNDGSVWCWGFNAFGQLGDGTGTDSSAPVRVQIIDDAIDVVAGGSHACALRADSSVWCWGSGSYDQVGPKAHGASFIVTPLAIPGLQAFRLAAGGGHTCAIPWDGSLVCWGLNANGQLGRSTPQQSDPNWAAVSGIAGAFAIAAGADHTCAIHAQGRITCWGANKRGQSGADPVFAQVGLTPVFTSKAYDIAAGSAHSCAIVGGGKPKCWGGNFNGQLTDGTTTDSSLPVP